MASQPTKQWTVTGSDKGFDGLEFRDGKVPDVGDTDVLVKFHAASINYRDLIIPKGEYPLPQRFPVIPGSDGAGEVITVGPRVTKWKAGDKVVTLFNQGHLYGELDDNTIQTGLGGVLDGTLRHYGAFHETGLMRLPSNLDYREASTLSCAALTAWNSLYGIRALKPGDTVLVQGTGGVSIFGLQFAKAAGAVVIATTSSTEKAEFLKSIGADHVINYREDKKWGETAHKLSRNQAGVDFVIDVTCAELDQSLKAIRLGGIIAVIGFLSGSQPNFDFIEALCKTAIVRGIYVGSRAQMDDMINAIEANGIKPILDKKTFKLPQLREAYEYMWAKSHIGKLVIDIE